MKDSMWTALYFCIFIVTAALLYNQGKKRSPYCYSPLSSGHDSIRLLRLMPHEDETADIQCELFEYSLQNTSKGTHLYDALSYVWGNPDEKLPIFLHEHSFNVTINLRAALSHLRNHSVERILWVDALCINQANREEKENQIQSMAKIYGQANRVIVWLGEAKNDSDLALKEIRAVRGKKSTKSLDSERIQQAVLALLQRPWFRRIWILQEVAAARQVLVMCGSKKIDGYAFCLGVDSLKDFYETRPDLQSLIRSVAYLIREAIFRPEYSMGSSGRSSLDICPLGELMDMYHAHRATERHDKVYALLGMSSDDLSRVDLLPDYKVPWEKILQQLAKYLLSERISVETWRDKEIAVIKSTACILGKISSVWSNIHWNGGQAVDVISRNMSGTLGLTGEWSSHWTLHPSAKPIMVGDVICHLQGASKPTIIRFCKDRWTIILITAAPPQTVRRGKEDVKWLEFLQLAKFLRSRTLQFVWDLGDLLRTSQDQGEFGELEEYSDKAFRLWNSALVLGDIEEYREAEEKFQEAAEGYETGFRKGNKHDTVADHLFLANGADLNLMNSRYSRPPLSWAAERGYKAVVELLLRGDDINVSLKEMDGRTPLLCAAVGGHLAVVELLLQEKAEVNAGAAYKGRTALQAAAGGGHLAVVERLLQEKAEVNVAAGYAGRTALQAAAGGGHFAVVERLLQEKAEVNAAAAYGYGRTALQAAAGGGHLAVVERLLQEKAEVNAAAGYEGRTTALQAAAEGGHLAVVERLLQEKAEVNGPPGYEGRTALQAAAGGGHLAVVERLRAEQHSTQRQKEAIL